MNTFNELKYIIENNINLDCKYSSYINEIYTYIALCEDQHNLSLDSFNYANLSHNDLVANNEIQFSIYSSKSYEQSYLNPEYSSKLLGNEVGPVLSAYFYSILDCLTYAYQSNSCQLNIKIGQVLDLVKLLNKEAVNSYDILKLVKSFSIENLSYVISSKLSQDYDIAKNYYTSICMESDLSNQKYLYKYGVPIGENELEFSKLLASYSQEEIDKIARHMVDSYLLGFDVRNKDFKSRSVSRVVSVIGLERITKSILLYLNSKDLEGHVVLGSSNSLTAQVDLDHQNDSSLFLDDEFINRQKSITLKTHSEISESLYKYMGNIIMLSFGQVPPKLNINPYKIAISKEKQSTLSKLNLEIRSDFEKYVPKSEISYTGMAFPSFETSSNYEEVFKEVMNINLCDPSIYLKIQNTLIETLDQGIYAKVKGRDGNKTNLTISLLPLSNPSEESNFMSCGADVNIPIGEVYTSPKLKGSHGTLHVKEITCSKKLYKDLIIEIKDGFATDFTCSNFNDYNAGKEYVKSNLFNGNDNLPIGEFAIGTNTYAYAVSKRLGIVGKLHTLIVEKMGPHIAFGDTCCAWSEDNLFIDNINGKKFTATDNEKSILRKEDISKAYCNIHKDITIPYDDIELISIINKDNIEIPIIKDGIFVLEGCEYLNIPLKK